MCASRWQSKRSFRMNCFAPRSSTRAMPAFAAGSCDDQQWNVRSYGSKRTERIAAFAVGQREVQQHDVDAATHPSLDTYRRSRSSGGVSIC